MTLASPAEVQARFAEQGLLVDDGLATAVHLALDLELPLLLEGEPGVGKTSTAHALAAALGTTELRLQCYEGISAHEALYEWNYQRQLLAIRLAESRGDAMGDTELYDERFLDDRPLLASLRAKGDSPAVLLIDEVDRADDEFEALLLEFLGEASVTIPELGTVRAQRRPVVVLTSNRSRDLHDALRRRCLYHWIDYPEDERVAAIVRTRVPAAGTDLVEAITSAVRTVRQLDLDKAPGLAETIDWARALTALGLESLDDERIGASIGTLAKTPDDRDRVLAALAGGQA